MFRISSESSVNKKSIFNILFVFSILAKYLNFIFQVHETLLACVWLDTNFLSFFLSEFFTVCATLVVLLKHYLPVVAICANHKS